jgi:hypothetical protein
VLLGALGKREAELGGDTTLDARHRVAVRSQEIRVTPHAAL